MIHPVGDPIPNSEQGQGKHGDGKEIKDLELIDQHDQTSRYGTGNGRDNSVDLGLGIDLNSLVDRHVIEFERRGINGISKGVDKQLTHSYHDEEVSGGSS